MKSEKNIQDFVNKLIKKKEGKSLDFKQKITSKEKIAKTLAALANTEGGYLLIGISDRRKIIGIDPEEERYMIESANEEFCEPSVSMELRQVKIANENYPDLSDEEELELLLVKVHPSPNRLIHVKVESGELKAYRREGDQTLAI